MKVDWITYDGTNPPTKGHGDVVSLWGEAEASLLEEGFLEEDEVSWRGLVAYFYYQPYVPPPPPLPKCWCGGKTEEWLGTDLMKYCGCPEHGGGWGTDEATAIKNWRKMREGV